MPHLVSRMHRARLARFFHRDVVRFDDNRRSGYAGAFLSFASFLAQLLNLIWRALQRFLPSQGGLEFMRQRQPILSRRGFEAAQRTDGALARAIGGLDGFHRQVVGVGLGFVDSSGLSNIHWPLHIAFTPIPVNTNCHIFSHYLRDAQTALPKPTTWIGSWPKSRKKCGSWVNPRSSYDQLGSVATFTRRECDHIRNRCPL